MARLPPPLPGGEGGAREQEAYGHEILARIARLCEAEPAREVCGFVVERGAALEVLPIRNVVDLHHAQDPAAFPRTSRDGYLMDPREQLRVYRDLARSGGRVLAVWHSHVETDARLSRKDREDALLDGVPTVPGAEYLVFAVRAGRAGEARRYRLRGSEFVELPLAWPR